LLAHGVELDQAPLLLPSRPQPAPQEEERQAAGQDGGQQQQQQRRAQGSGEAALELRRSLPEDGGPACPPDGRHGRDLAPVALEARCLVEGEPDAGGGGAEKRKVGRGEDRPAVVEEEEVTALATTERLEDVVELGLGRDVGLHDEGAARTAAGVLHWI